MEKETVKVFDLQAAFKALDEIEAPKTKGLKSTRVNLKERFSAKDATTALVEDYYSVTTHEALEEAQEDRESEIAKAKLARIEKIVDLDAETEDDLLPSYVGKVIIQCPQCMTLFYKKPEDIEHSEENPDVVNINEVCQHCGNTSGYTLIGKVDSVKEEEANEFEIPEEENELDLDFPEATEETSPEGTGGGFEDELELEIEDSGSEDELDLNLEEVELEPTEESLKITEAKEDSDSGDADEAEVTVTLGEIKDVAEEAGKAIVNAEVEEKEDVKEVTDKVVEKEVEAKETLTENLNEATVKEIETDQACAALLDGEQKFAGSKEECEKFIAEHPAPEGHAWEVSDKAKVAVAEESYKDCKETLVEAPQTPDEIERILMDVAASFDESLEECNKPIKENGVSNNEFHKMINSEVWKDFDEDLKEDWHRDLLNIKAPADGSIVVGVKVSEPLDNAISSHFERILSAKDEGTNLLKAIDDAKDQGLKTILVILDATIDPATEARLDKVIYADNLEEDWRRELLDVKAPAEGSIIIGVKSEEPLDSAIVDHFEKVLSAKKEGASLLKAIDEAKEQGIKTILVIIDDVIDSAVSDRLDKVIEADNLEEDLETVKAKLPEYCDALEHAGEEVAKEVEAEKAAEVEVKAEEPVAEVKAEEVAEEPVVEESLTEAKVGSIPSNLPWWIHIMDDEVEEDYTGTPEIRTTHLEYEDKDPTDGKAVLPDNLGEELEEHIQDRPAPVEDETVIQGGDNAVVDCQTEHKIIAHSEDEKPLDCKMEKEPLEKPVAGEKVDIKINEDINITNNDSPARVDNRTTTKEEPKVEEGILGGVKDVVDGVVNGVENILGEEKVEECNKTEEGLGLLGVGDVNINLDASGQNNAVGVGGGEGKTESCHGEDCKEEGLIPDLGNLPTPELPGLPGLPKLEELEDFNESFFDKSVNEFLKEVYENVNEYKTNSCEVKEGKIFVEGTILFNSGRAKKTIFEFLPVKEELGSLILEGYNKDLTEEKAFTVKGALEGGNQFITESFGYKYTINETLVEGLK